MLGFSVTFKHFLSWILTLVFFAPQRLFPWVGLRKINVSYWGWEDMSPFTNSSLRWQPGEPNDSGFCAYLEEPQISGLKANPCTATANGLICEKAIGERRILNHRCASLYKEFSFLLFWGGSSQETPTRTAVRPVKSPARCTPTAATAPARARSACGAAARSAAWTPLPMSYPSPTASVWSGKREIVLVSGLLNRI